MATDTSSSRSSDDLESLEAGLDALDSNEGRQRLGVRRIAARTLGIAVTLLIVLALWWFISLFKTDDRFPSPVEAYLQFRASYGFGDLGAIIYTSVHRAIIGFAISVLIATPLGLLVWSVRIVRRYFSPILSGLQSLPSVAWVPPAVIWFGPTQSALYFVVLMGAIPSIANGLMSGLDNIPQLYRRAGFVLGARGRHGAQHVLLPAALPGYISGLRQGWAFSWRSLMAAELIVQSFELGQGLGATLDQARELGQMGTMFATIAAILFVGVVIELCFFAPVERTILARRGLGALERGATSTSIFRTRRTA